MGSPKEVAISSNVVPELTQALEDWERRYGLQGLWWLEKSNEHEKHKSIVVTIFGRSNQR